MLKKLLIPTIFFLIVTAIIAGTGLYFENQPPALAAGNIYYVDPDWTGAENGTASQPWSALNSATWVAINNSLTNGDVTIYFSAREANSDIGEMYGGRLSIYRTSTSSYRLTVDGMSKWNTDDTYPSWQDYMGNSKLKLSPSASIALGWYEAQQDNITMRGFEVSGSVARVMFAGDNLIVEHIYSHDITTNGATVQMAYANNDSCIETYGRFSNVIIRNNYIENGYGESIYVGGTNSCPSYGNSHDNILIENNTIINAGVNGAQGDGIDVKNGITNVTVRGNTIIGARNLGITAAGVYSGNQNLLIENNKIYGGLNRGIQVGSGTWSAYANGATIRNNIVYNNTDVGISITGSGQGSQNINIYNNTVYGNGKMGLSYGTVNNHNSKNNLVFANNNNGNQISIWGTNTNIVSDYNLYSPSGGYGSEGTNSLIVSDASGLVINAVNGDFNLKSGSQAIDSGITLVDFYKDYFAWDIGAYEYIQAPPPPPPPPLKGDFNSDSKVNDADFLSLKNVFKNIVSALNSIFDLNSDSAIDVKDLGVLMSGWRL